MISYNTIIHKFAEQGEKTGWTYIEVPAEIASELNPGVKKSFRVKGTLDKHKIAGVAMIPMGGGYFIIALNATLRKAIAKKEGAMINVQLDVDTSAYQLNIMLVEGIESSIKAKDVFYKMPKSHQHYYSKWIDSAKTITTQEKRVILVVVSLEKGISYGEMLREQAAIKKML